MTIATPGIAEVGPMLSGRDLEMAVRAVLQEWLPSYIAEYERQHQLEVGATPAPRGWAVTGRDLAKLNSDQLPCVVIMAGGIVQAPRKEGGYGCLTAIWGVDIGSVFAAAWGGASRLHAQLYAACVRTLLLQRPIPVGDTYAVADWRAEGYDEMDFESSRSYSASIVSFNLEVREVAWADGGPPPFVEPPADPTQPFDPWPTVQSTDATVNNQPPD